MARGIIAAAGERGGARLTHGRIIVGIGPGPRVMGFDGLDEEARARPVEETRQDRHVAGLQRHAERAGITRQRAILDIALRDPPARTALQGARRLEDRAVGNIARRSGGGRGGQDPHAVHGVHPGIADRGDGAAHCCNRDEACEEKTLRHRAASPRWRGRSGPVARFRPCPRSDAKTRDRRASVSSDHTSGRSPPDPSGRAALHRRAR